ncbi:MAG: hypothetical protein QME54_03780 [Actinomycetota bacterium]|nr:hypothetical protein [Actinomycetota bacterium]
MGIVVLKLKKVQRYISMSILITILLLLLASPAQGSIVLFPSRIEVFVPPGGSEIVEVNAANTGKNPLKCKINSWDFARDEKGIAHPIHPEDVKVFRGCGGWLDFHSKSMTVSPDETGTFKFTVNVPRDAEYGTHYTYVTIAGTPILPKEKGKGITIRLPMTYRIHALLLVMVSKPGESSEVPVLKRSAKLKDLMIGYLNFSNSVPIKIKIENTGNCHLILRGIIEIWKGKYKGETIRVPEYTLLPMNTLIIPTTWRSPALFGKFRAKLIGDAGLNKPIKAEKTFWVISWELLLPALLGIALLIASFILFLRKFRIQLARRT